MSLAQGPVVLTNYRQGHVLTSPVHTNNVEEKYILLNYIDLKFIFVFLFTLGPSTIISGGL
jgi:hypothetical protein